MNRSRRFPLDRSVPAPVDDAGDTDGIREAGTDEPDSEIPVLLPRAPEQAAEESAPAELSVSLHAGEAGSVSVEPLWSTLVGSEEPPPRSTRPLRITLVGEGAYPFGPGGVSLWCHQLVQGMPEHVFDVVALTVNGHERPIWQAPDNLERVVSVPLWGPGRARLQFGACRPEFAEAHEALLRVVLQTPEAIHASETVELEEALRGMLEHARGGDVAGELQTDAAVQRLLDLWRSCGPGRSGGLEGRLTLRDAVAFTSRLAHMLRPLSQPPLQADVCHLSMNGLSVLVALRSRWAFGTPIVLSEHGVYLRERYLGVTSDAESHAVRWLTVRFHRALARTGYRIADILAPHSAFNRRWQLYNGGQPERVETMYNGIDPAQFPIAEDEPEVPTIVFVGRIDPLKDVHTLLRSFALVRAGLPQARLRIFGPVTRDNEGYHESCVRLAEDLGLAGAVTFEGRIPQVVDAYRAGHVVALTSTSEGFPYTIVEAMSVGRPTVATDVGGVSEAVGDAGFVVPPRDPEAIAQACLTLLADPALRREMGERARRRVLELFTLRQWTEAYRDIYELLSGPMRSRQVELPVASAADAEAVVTDVPA